MTVKISESRRQYDTVTIGPETTLTEGAEAGYRRLREGLYEQMEAAQTASQAERRQAH